MKLTSSLVAAASLWLALACSPDGQAAQTTAATLTAGRVPGFPGQTAEVPLRLSHTGVVAGVQFDLVYAPGETKPGALQSASGLSNTVVRFREVELGVYRVLAYSTKATTLQSNTSIGQLSFTLPAGDIHSGANVIFTNAQASSRQAGVVSPVALIPGGVSVSQVFLEEDGTADFYLRVQPDETYVIQATTNLFDWLNLSTNFTSADILIARDVSARNYNYRFYRAVRLARTPASGSFISDVRLQPGNQIVFSYASTVGRAYVLQSSTNLLHWTEVMTNVAELPRLNFTNLISPTIPGQFFRILERP